ncbi:sugar transferase [Gaetbulibacter jejuensis]|uniref:Sugar transferase n=1 Tax=Gaetbulibacter jejuensis TaxID=584607 RepID=A0ABN1JW12_9FLAO
MLSTQQLAVKRSFDLALSLLLLPVLLLPILLLIILATIDTKQWGLFSQERVGQHGRLFKIYKLRTLKQGAHQLGQFDVYASSLGKLLRRTKVDELPQLFNVILGQMSFVGPRPDVVGYADCLEGDDRIVLSVKPGITGPATLKYKAEDVLLSQQADPQYYNDSVIWPDKVKINKKYVENWSFCLDLTMILKSIAN